MEQRIRDRYQDNILQEAMQRYGIGEDSIPALGAVENFVYEFERGPQRCILRIGHSLRRSKALIEGEVDWINFLAEGGVSVSRAIPSEKGNLVEAIEDGQGGQFLATAFVKAQGQPPHDLWTPGLYAAYGQLIGRMHALAEHYQPALPEWRRHTWEVDIDFVERFLPDSEIAAKQKYRALCDHVRTLPTDSRSYGLIHNDAHGSNLRVDESGRLTIFDFDECAYSWYASDIANVLFFMTVNEPDPDAITQEFMPPFLLGYRQEHPLDPRWLGELPVFLKMAEIFLYAAIYRDFGAGPIDDPWAERFMRGRKERIEGDVPVVEGEVGQ